MIVSRKGKKTLASHPHSSGGIWYLVRLPSGGQLICHSFNDAVSEPDHSQFWESRVAPFLAIRWKLSKHQSAELHLLVYGFPRGRVVKSTGGYTFFNGDDFSAFVTKNQIAGAFLIRSGFTFRFDEHEQCQFEDKQGLRALLGIDDDWPATPG